MIQCIQTYLMLFEYHYNLIVLSRTVIVIMNVILFHLLCNNMKQSLSGALIRLHIYIIMILCLLVPIM